MQPIQLKLVPQSSDATTLHCPAFVLLTPRGDRSIAAAVATIACDDDYRGGRLFALPVSGRDVSVAGIVWLPGSTGSVKCPPGAIPLRAATSTDELPGSLWIPSGARLLPGVGPNILSQHLSADELIRVWLPSIGLVGFTAEDQLGPRDWLTVPESSTGNSWVSPPESWSPPRGIIEFGMRYPPSAENFLQQIQREIGDPDRSLLDTNADGTGESKPSAAARAKNWLLDKLDSMAGKDKGKQGETNDQGRSESSTSAAGGIASRAGSMIGAGMGAVAAPLAAAMSHMLQGERERQVEKLLGMFDTNPDAALKYAIPLGGITDAFRGFSIPGSSLLERMVDFSLPGLGGGAGQPIDLWSIGFDLQAKLQERYRAQANRELAAGRYRRAAYIFAHLLADFRGAAQALEKGRFYPEAAVIYRDHLKDRKQAARCFALGGMHREASDLYVELKMYEDAGEVLAEAGLEDEARQMFETAFTDRLASGQVVSAAKILDLRLQRRPDAIELLSDQWPDGNEPVAASEAAMEWLGEDGDHQQASELLNSISNKASESNYAQLAHLSERVANGYPDHQVRQQAEDHCRLAVARTLEHSSAQDRWRALATFASLDSKDPQLRRDTQIYTQATKVQRLRARPSAAPRRWIRLPDLHLPVRLRYLDYRMERGQLFALATRRDRLILVHAPSPDPGCEVNLNKASELINSSRLLGSQAFIKSIEFESPMSVHVVACANVSNEMRLPSDQALIHPTPSFEVEKIDESVIAAVSVSPGDLWQMERLDGNLVLRHSSGQTHDLTKLWVDSWNEITGGDGGQACLAVVNGSPIAALENVLVKPHHGEISRIAIFDEPVRALAAPRPKTRSRIAAAHAAGLEVLFLDTYDLVHVCRQRGYSLCMWATGGMLVAWSDGELHCFEARRGTYARVAEIRFDDRSDEPTRLLMLNADIVGVAYANGHISRYRLPR